MRAWDHEDARTEEREGLYIAVVGYEMPLVSIIQR